MDYYKAILINVPVELLKRLNQASVALALSRSELIAAFSPAIWISSSSMK